MNEAQTNPATPTEDNMFSLPSLDPARIDNGVLRDVLVRIKERCLPDAHADYHTKHSSHSTHSKGW